MSIFHFNGFQSPPRRPLIIPSPTSPFSTSPSQLEEVTLDYEGTLTNSLDARSPPIGAPMRGRSVKEYEDQLSGLKKENFNLKLRIYFLEERMGTNYNLDKEHIIKKNVELMVEVENLRKDLKDKHELLCQADKALELQDDEYRKSANRKDEMIADLKLQISELKRNRSAAQSQETTCMLEEQVKTLKDELHQEKEHRASVQLLITQRDQKIHNLSEEFLRRDKEFIELTQKFDELSEKNRLLLNKLQEAKHLINNLKMENSESNKKRIVLHAEFEQMKKRYDSLKISSEEKIIELQTNLEISSADLKKSQELVVSSSKQDVNPIINNHNNSFSVPKPTISPKCTKTNQISITTPQITFLSSSSSPLSSSSPPPTLPVSSTTNNQLLSPTSSSSLSNTTDNIVQQLKNEREHYLQKTIKLKAEQLKACHMIKQMIGRQSQADKEIETLKQKIKHLEGESEPAPSKSEQTSKNSMDDGGNKEQLVEQYQSRIHQLEEDYQALLSSLEEKNSELQHYQNQQEEFLDTIKVKDDRIVDLEFKMLSNTEEFECKLKDKNREIEKLTNEVSKKNSDLQGIVNKELWDKNREIGKLQTMHVSRIIEQKDEKIQNLESELSTKQQQLDLIKTKISELGIEINHDNDNDNNYQLKNHLQDELVKSEKLRYEANEVCTTLSRRLEELAVFLDSLLKQKTVLGFLGNKENRKLREIIDQSLDLTRSFSMSMLLNPEQSLTQLTNITNILNDTTIDHNSSNATLTFQSHLYNNNINNNDDDDISNKENKDEPQNNSQIIEALRQQIITLKYELRLRDVELNKMNTNDIANDKQLEKSTNLNTTTTTSTTLKYQSDIQSESESWSEPDRSVSRARIGLFKDDKNLKSPTTTTKKTTNFKLTSESDEMCRNSRTPRKHENYRQTIIELNHQLHELEQNYNDEQMKNRQLIENIEELKIKHQQYEEQINRLQIDKATALNVAREAEDVAEIAKNEMKSSEVMIQQLQKNINDYQQQLEDEYKKQLQQIEDNAKIQIETLQETIQHIREDCVENCAKKYELQAAFNQLETTQKLLEKSQKQIDDLTEQQRVNEELLNESQNKITALRKHLDDSKLEYSEIVLEKTKLTNEKTSLEQELSNLITKHSTICRKLEEVEKQLNITRENHQKELMANDEQKSRLELRISELESTNAQLQNRLIKIQTGYGNINNNEPILLSASLPNYRRQLSDHSGYTSEEHQLVDVRNNGGVNNNRRPNLIDVERQEGNSSPDLGIESDHGRFSSLETHLNLPRPLLQTLELTESMNNLLDGDTNAVQTINCGDVRCSERTKRLTGENNDLKRELVKTKHVLEETVNQLALANQRKKQIEKTICRQIHKTSQVLKKAKANLDSGSETDLHKK